MSDDGKCYAATPAATLEEHILNSNIAKSDTEWWAHREITRLRADLAAVTVERDRMREALKPLASIDVELLDENKKPTGIHAFDTWDKNQVVFDIGKDRKIIVADLRRARAALEGVTEPTTGDSNA